MGGRPQPGWFGHQERRTRPEPPAWLSSDCRDFGDLDSELTEVCELLTVWREDYAAAQVEASVITQRTQGEAPSKTKWWSHLHLDGLWSMPSASVTYGVVGVHVTFTVAGRWQAFLAPGVMLLNVPTGPHTRAWRPATDVGLSYRLIDLTIPGSRRQATLHVNMAKAWLFAGADD